MNQRLLNSLTDAERLLVAETERDALKSLDEDELLDLHQRIRRARTKYVKNYRRAASAAVEQRGGRGFSYPKNQRDRDKAELFELSLARVSREVAAAANRAAAALKAERLEAARTPTSAPKTTTRPPRTTPQNNQPPTHHQKGGRQSRVAGLRHAGEEWMKGGHGPCGDRGGSYASRITAEGPCPPSHHHRSMPGSATLSLSHRLFASDRVGLLSVLATIPDPRKPRGVRHRLAVVLGVAVCAVLAGARSMSRSPSGLPMPTLRRWTSSGSPGRWRLSRRSAGLCSGWTPTPSTTRSGRGPRPAPRQSETASADRGGRQDAAWIGHTTVSPAGHLLAALDHTHGVVVGQVDVEAKTNEIPMFTTLLDSIELAGAVVTADAMHAQRGHADLPRRRGAHYVLTVKRNQPRPARSVRRVALARRPGRPTTPATAVMAAPSVAT